MLTNKEILILSDSKPGHYNQSLGIVERLPHDIGYEVKQVKFKRKWRDNLLRVLTRLLFRFNPSSSFIRDIFRWSMDERCADEILSLKRFDLILSTGSSVAAPNLLLSRLLGAKSVVCTRPSPLGIKYFDLAILPEHSRPRRSKRNVLMTLGVPNRITPEKVDLAGQRLSMDLNLVGKKFFGLLLGGEDPYYSIPPELAVKIIDVLINTCKIKGYYLVLTTSRRTRQDTEIELRSRLKTELFCSLAIYASEPQSENPVPGIIGISEVTVVTEDSFSMVCEAASSGRKVVVLNVHRKRRKANAKRERAYELMAEEQFIYRTDIVGLQDVLLSLADKEVNVRILEDSNIAANAILRLLYSQ